MLVFEQHFIHEIELIRKSSKQYESKSFLSIKYVCQKSASTSSSVNSRSCSQSNFSTWSLRSLLCQFNGRPYDKLMTNLVESKMSNIS